MALQSSIRTGGEVDTLCKRCALDLAHTILAMVGPKIARVRCNTCGSEHAFRGEQPLLKTHSLARPRAEPRAKEPSASPRARASEAPSAAVPYDELFKGKDITRARVYAIRDRYAEGEVIDHPTFGLGVVTALRPDGKLEATFRGGPKTLVHAKAGGASLEASRPSFHRPHHEFQGFADKVPAPGSEAPGPIQPQGAGAPPAAGHGADDDAPDEPA